MILKKSNILLISIAIFLLISIGSVCASDNITDVSDDTLADDGTDVVLSNSDTEENVADDTQTEKINTTVETDKDKYEFKQDTNKSFTVEVKDKDNESNKINVNKSDLSVLNGNKNVSFEYTGSIMTITEALPVGNYNLTINYLGNENFINSTKVIGVKIYGNNTIETETSVVCNGKNIEIPVKVYDGVEYIELNKTNFNLTLVYTNETGNISNLTIYDKDFIIDNGTIKFNTTVKLIAASVIIGYANAEPKTVNIKVSTEVKANADKDKFKSEENKTISITILNGENQLNVVKNDLKVFENGNEITNFEYNNSKITLELDVGVHNLTIIYLGNETYTSSNTTAIVNVSGNNTINVPESVVSDGNTVEIPVTLFDGVENIVLTKEFNMTLTYTNKSGNTVTVNLTNDDYEITADGKIKFNVENYEWIQASININYVNSTGSKDVQILLNSSVQATPDKTKYGENEINNITVKVKDNKGNELNITKNDLKVYDNGVEITDFTFNNGTLNVNLNIGVHNLTIVYVGNATYTTSNVSIEQKVNGSLRFNPDEIVVLTQNKDVIITINLNDGADFIDIDPAKLTVELFYSVNGGNYSKTINISEITINGQNISFKVNEVFDSASAYIKYDNLNATTKIKVNTTIDASDMEYGESEVKNITVTVVADNGYNINITKDNIQVINRKDGKALTIEVNDSVITIKDALKFGVYNLTIKYLGTDTFLASDKNITLTVYGINATNKTNINSTKKGEVKINIVNGNSNVTATSDDLTLTVTYKDGNETKNITVSNVELNNGTLAFTLENGNFTTATLTIKYRNTTSNVTLNRIYNFKAIPQTVDADYQEGNFTFLIVDIDDNDKPLVNKSVSISGVNSAGTNLVWTIITGESTYSLNTKIQLKTDENGIITLNNKGFSPGYTLGENVYSPAGDYNITIGEDGNIKGSQKIVITINKINLKITLEHFSEYYDSNKKFTIVVTNAKSGKAISGVSVNFEVSLDGEIKEYTSKDADGKTIKVTSLTTNADGKIELPTNYLMTGIYTIKTNVNNTDSYNAASNKDTAEIKKIPVVISAKDVTIYYNTGTSATIKITKDGKALKEMYVLVRLYSTSSKYSDYLFQTDKKGQISFSASLAVGKHKFIVKSADNRYEAKDVTKTITVKKASAKITAKKVTAYYKGGQYFTVKLTNTKNKKAIYDGKVNIKVFVSKNRYYNYVGNTGMNGQLKLLLDSLKPGTYKVIVSGADNKNFAAKQVTTKIVIKKAPTKFIAKKLTAKKGKNKYFKVTVKNKKTNKVIPNIKIKVKVYTGKKAKTYSLKVNSKGIAKLSVKKLKVGTHKVIITSANKYCVAKSTKSVIKIKK